TFATTASAATTSASAPATVAATAAAAAFAATSFAASGAGRAAIECRHVLGLRSFLSLAHLELHLLPFFELAEPAALDRGEVHKAIFSAVIRRDETIPLLCIEPLHYPCGAH